MGNNNNFPELLSEAEVELMLDLMDRSRGNSCTEDWSDSTELVMGNLVVLKKTWS